MNKLFALIGLTMIGSSAFADDTKNHHPSVNTADADRFAVLFNETGGEPTVQQLETRYLQEAGSGLILLQRTRFGSADKLHAAIAAQPQKYQRAIEVCLPLAKRASDDLRTIYKEISVLLPDYDLPEVHAVIGAGTSAGTAQPGVQVLGLETICAAKQTQAEILETFRFFFAHETIHAFQGLPDTSVVAMDPLLYASIYEGTADYIATLVTGQVPDKERNSWAEANAEMLWSQYSSDRQTLKESSYQGGPFTDLPEEARAAFVRWHFNAGIAPEGWPVEAGYWIGRQIVSSYMENSNDPDADLRSLLTLQDPEAVLQRSKFAERLAKQDN